MADGPNDPTPGRPEAPLQELGKPENQKKLGLENLKKRSSEARDKQVQAANDTARAATQAAILFSILAYLTVALGVLGVNVWASFLIASCAVALGVWGVKLRASIQASRHRVDPDKLLLENLEKEQLRLENLEEKKLRLEKEKLGLENLEKLAAEARHKDIQAANDTARAATQAAILINGGAATAILAYLAKETPAPPIVVNAALLSLVVYAAGVAAGAVSLWCSAWASAKFGLTWENVVSKNERGQDQLWIDAHKWLGRHQGSFAWSIAFFLIASCVVALGFLRVISSSPRGVAL